jgi:16S rRNA (guanine1207-N2)-methyltransferase
MSSHYYSQKPNSSGKKITISTNQFGNYLSFKSQSGVFSWKKVDTGSEILLQNAQLPKTGLILDLGCGYGFLGISIAKAYPHLKVVLTDINELAIRLTKANRKQNKVEENTQVFQGHLFKPLANMKFDLILTNPPIMAGKAILTEIIEQSIEHLTPKGSIQLVVPKKKGLLSMQKMLEKTYGSFEVIAKKSGFWVLKGNK